MVPPSHPPPARPAWWRRKRWWIPTLGVVALAAIGALSPPTDDGGVEVDVDVPAATGPLPVETTSPSTLAATVPPSGPSTIADTTTTTTNTTVGTAPVPGDVTGLLAGIVVTREVQGGYDRALFGPWVDADGDCADTRQEVLREEGLDVAGACAATTGRWLSVYDGQEVTDVALLDVDHLVPLKEAWDSGAWAWTPQARQAFANDLRAEALVVATATSNRSKGDRDPSNWMPDDRALWCAYAADWVRVKVSWGLSADESEAGRLRNVLAGCTGAETLVGLRPATPTATSIASPPPPAPTPVPTTTPSPPPDVFYPNCGAAREAGVAPLHRATPGYRPAMDGDDDGIACE